MGFDRNLGVDTGLFPRDEGMDARLGDETRIGRRYTKTVKEPESGAVYVIATVGAPFVKIGWVKKRERVNARCEMIQIGCPYPLQVVVTVAVKCRRAETLLHRTFATQHFRGEWFRCEGRLKQFVHIAVAYPELKLEELIEKSS